MAYFLSSDIGLNVKVLVLNAHGSSPEMADPPLSYTDYLSRKTQLAACDMLVSCQLHTHGRQQGVPERTCNTPGSRLRWNEWVSFRAKYSNLSPDAYITLSVCGSHGPRASRTVGHAHLALFDASQQLRTGVVKLRLHLLEAGEALPTVEQPDWRGATDNIEDEMACLDALMTRHERILTRPDPALDWLNGPTYSYLEERQQAGLCPPPPPRLGERRREG